MPATPAVSSGTLSGSTVVSFVEGLLVSNGKQLEKYCPIFSGGSSIENQGPSGQLVHPVCIILTCQCMAVCIKHMTGQAKTSLFC